MVILYGKFFVQASRRWIENFKRENRIVSRHVTKITNKPIKNEMEELEKSGRDFIERQRPIFRQFQKGHVGVTL